MNPRNHLTNVATLADSTTATTCSALVARRLRLRIVPSGSFENAVALVKAGVAQVALVPGAYPPIGNFFMDPELRLVRSFAAEIPALVLAAKPKARPPFYRIFAHAATKPFWPQLDAPIVEASSNDAAAAAVNSGRVACVTNSVAAKHAGLTILHVFREAAPMSWNLFARAGGNHPHTPASVPAPAPASTTTQAGQLAAHHELQPAT